MRIDRPISGIVRGVHAAAVAAAMAFAASCAPLPPPASPPVPPQERPPAPPPAPPEEIQLDRAPAVDVGLAVDLDSLSLSSEQTQVLDQAGPSGAITDLGRMNGVLDARARGGSLVVRARLDGRESSLPMLGANDTLWVGARDPEKEAASRIRWNGRTWRGALKIFVNPRGKLTLVTRLPLDTYLMGVLPGEIGGLSDPILEAGRAQAVAARSYTLFYLGRRAAEGFDLYATVEDQVYGPVETEQPTTTRCVEGTAGRVAVSAGRPIRANYCSTCGGITAEAWEAWPTEPYPYLTSHADRDNGDDYCSSSTQYRWREEWSVTEFLGTLVRYAPTQGLSLPEGGLGQLIDVRADARSRSGRVWRLTVVTSRAQLVIPAYSIRQVLRRPGNAGAILRSNLFKVAVLREPGTRRALSVVMSGGGSGHGVGLCQVGAIAMARAGRSADAILQHYYPGAAIRKLY